MRKPLEAFRLPGEAARGPLPRRHGLSARWAPNPNTFRVPLSTNSARPVSLCVRCSRSKKPGQTGRDGTRLVRAAGTDAAISPVPLDLESVHGDPENAAGVNGQENIPEDIKQGIHVASAAGSCGKHYNGRLGNFGVEPDKAVAEFSIPAALYEAFDFGGLPGLVAQHVTCGFPMVSSPRWV